ncbi:MAG: hypothetical protein H6719_17550 [Sandaracinaceae bacterium]|nr:hypothetical protein [Sandaracinaceae bacterium]
MGGRGGRRLVVVAALWLAACGGEPSPLACEGSLEIQPPDGPGAGSYSGTVTTEPGASVRVLGQNARQIRADASGHAALSGDLEHLVNMDEPLQVECYLEGRSKRQPATMIVHEELRPTPMGARSTGLPMIEFEIHGAEVAITGPTGTTIAFGAEQVTIETVLHPARIELDPTTLISGLGVEPGSDTEAPQPHPGAPITRDVTITRPGGSAPWSTTITWPESALLDALASALGRVEQGPLAIEPDGTGAARVVLVATPVVDRPTRYRLAASDGTIDAPGDVGVVGIAYERERTGSCGTYESSAGGVVTMEWSARDAEVHVYDRRTGRQLGERTISAPRPPCSNTLHSSPHTEFSFAAVLRYVNGVRR